MKKEKFQEIKNQYLSKFKLNNFQENLKNNFIIKEKKEKPYEIKQNEQITENINNIENIDKYREEAQTLIMFKETESKSLDTTKRIINDLSQLMTEFSKKVVQQSSLTQESKI